jgi:parallel beta-helix repeat protein
MNINQLKDSILHNKARTKFRNSTKTQRAFTAAAVCAVIGVLVIQSSGAATFVVNSETEAGVLGGLASQVDDAGASGSKSVRFGSAGGGNTGTWPTTPPAQICGNQSILGNGPTSAPAGATVVPAGDNSSLFFTFRNAGKTFWFAPGVHHVGSDIYAQINPGNNTTFIGAPGAIIDGQGINMFAFTGQATGVTIRYLTIQNFAAPLDQGVVNHDAGTGWTIEYNTVTKNGGAGLMAGKDNIYRYNCMSENGQYAINSCCGGETAATDIQNFVLDHNEITRNNTGDWERINNGCGCTGGVKFWLNKDVTVTNNWVHHNYGPGLWMDNNNRGFIIENNYISDNDGYAVFAEAGYDFSVRNNNILRNAVVFGKEFASRQDSFVIGAIYVSESGSPAGYNIRTVPSVISNNNFDNNWGGVAMWENPDRYSGSGAHTHVSGTLKIGSLYTDEACSSAVADVIPSSVDDKYKCRWSTENVVVENNIFRIDKNAIGAGCAGADYCGLSGIFSATGSMPEFGGYEIPWRMTFQQGNVFRNNTYKGDWNFAGFERSRPGGSRVPWTDWRAPAPTIPAVFTHDNRPETFGQDKGSTLTLTP